VNLALRVTIVPLFALFTFAPPAHALEPIDTDGPDFVESSEVVAKGHFQYEVDLASVRNRRTDQNGITFSTPALLKYGAADNFEIRIAPGGFARQDGRTGAGDVAFGFKWHARDRNPEQGNAAVSWILHVETPSGSSQFRGNGLRPSVRSVMTWDLPRDLALGLMPGIKSDTRGDGHRFTSAIFGAVLNKRINDRFRAFVEFSAPQMARADDGGVLASWDIGAAWLVGNDIQIGVRAGVAANRNTPNGYALVELAQRF